ncbi:MAG: NADH-quinone oxidoreductase subunit, partial [Frankiales bacterium]|nr:NADH-quinone oxidoreductase subunit [Frankiales bacterium]
MHNVSLLVLLAIPLVGSGVVFALPKGSQLLAKQITLFASTATFVYAVVLGVLFKTSAGAARFQFNGSWVWIRSLGVHFAFGLDGIALVLVVMSTLLVPVVVLASWDSFDTEEDAEEIRAPDAPQRDSKTYFALLLVLEV